MPRRHIALFALAAALGPSGCALLADNTRPTNYSNSAKENYDRGLAELKSENWLDAIKYFQFTRAKFGFSKWATLAELGIADANLGHEKYQEAVDAYHAFGKAHPTHEMVQNGYVSFKIADSYYKQIPSEWFMVPPAWEKDMGPVKETLRELSAFADEYPDSPYVKEAHRRIADCQRRLADHELYVAEFYLNRDKPLAAVSRLEGVVKDFPHSIVEPDALLLLGRTWLKMEKPGEAKGAFDRLVVSYPNDFHARKAKVYLDYIRQRYGVVAVPAPPPAKAIPKPPASAPPPPVAEPPTDEP